MKKILTSCLVLPLMLFLALDASAQRGGGGGGGRGGGGGGGIPGDFSDAFRRSTIYWFPNIDRVVKKTSTDNGATPKEADPATDAGGGDRGDMRDGMLDRNNARASSKKYIFVYVRHPLEKKDPSGFQSNDLVDASRKEWAFVKMDLDEDNRWQQQWGISKAPSVVGCDIYGNDFRKFAGNSNNLMRGMLKVLPKMIYTFETKLKADYKRAIKEIETNRDRGLGKFVSIALIDKQGYEEIENSLQILLEEGEKDFEKGELAETGSVDKAITFYQGMSSTYKTSPVGLQAEIRIARLEHSTGKIRAAILRLQKVLKVKGLHLEEVHTAAEGLLEDIIAEGDAKIDLAVAGDAKKARTKLYQIAKDYAVTEVAKRAQEELRHLK